MTTDQLVRSLIDNHSTTANFICSLTDAQFVHSHSGKWSAAQQLSHLILCLMPINQALAARDYIREKFGVQSRAAMSYDDVIANYKAGLQNGGKAPERFLPPVIDVAQRDTLRNQLDEILIALRDQISTYSEAELDTLVLPHPFMGLLSIREMLYLMSYHPLHHLAQVKEHLVQPSA
ncbi:MAG: DinB family protein [Sphingobacteriales bacterium]|nr:MAG: DinB family protein [Sphingobacteriales bacterium]